MKNSFITTHDLWCPGIIPSPRLLNEVNYSCTLRRPSTWVLVPRDVLLKVSIAGTDRDDLIIAAWLTTTFLTPIGRDPIAPQ